MKYAYLVSRSTTIRILLYFTPTIESLESSSLVMKSIITKLYSRSNTNKGCKSLYSLYRAVLALLQTLHWLTTSTTRYCNIGNV
jgi:hypothetical protein